jgi:crotonobetainyl-CoA:carnitine CoA-transferase CaiB-like acyl-CoA transferase
MGGPDCDPAQWFATQDATTIVDRLVEAGIPAAVVISPSAVIENPQLVHRGFFESLTHPSTGPGLYPCPPFARPDGVDKWLYRAPPTLGQHNGEVLTELCGLTEEHLQRLAADGVIGTRPKGL